MNTYRRYVAIVDGINATEIVLSLELPIYTLGNIPA
jgi:hypothetical protein